MPLASGLHESRKLYVAMKTARVTVPWPQGLHLRIAAQLVRLAHRFRSQINLCLDSTVADGRSTLSLLLLSASLGTPLTVRVVGEDEREALNALESFFASPGPDESTDAPACVT